MDSLVVQNNQLNKDSHLYDCLTELKLLQMCKKGNNFVTATVRLHLLELLNMTRNSIKTPHTSILANLVWGIID